MNLLVGKKSFATVEIYVYENEEGGMISSHDLKEIPSGIKPDKFSFKFKKPNFGESSKILGLSQEQVNDQTKINASLLQQQSLKTLMVDWDLTDSEGKKIDFSKSTIDELDPAIARSIFVGLLEKINL